MSLYNTLTETEKKIFDTGANHALDLLDSSVMIVHKMNPDCTTIKIKDFYIMISTAKEGYKE